MINQVTTGIIESYQEKVSLRKLCVEMIDELEQLMEQEKGNARLPKTEVEDHTKDPLNEERDKGPKK